ncbi:hypothetical protein QMZ05_29240 [Bradyrhizobium sp. INPA03-11B]|uniref:hypothetical protein n=1 Tax=Bradyrhizobium sp. INPA03-11B TaxID=418598 RepID=UPI00338D8EA6
MAEVTGRKLLAALMLVASVGAARADEELPSVVKIASQNVTANGCHDTTQSFTTSVPHPERLDRSYHGVLDGIEVRVTAANNGHSYSNFAWKDDHTITYTLYAKGAGHWVDPPKIFGTPIGGGWCAGAAGGSMGIEIFAHYK